MNNDFADRYLGTVTASCMHFKCKILNSNVIIKFMVDSDLYLYELKGRF